MPAPIAINEGQMGPRPNAAACPQTRMRSTVVEVVDAMVHRAVLGIGSVVWPLWGAGPNGSMGERALFVKIAVDGGIWPTVQRSPWTNDQRHRCPGATTRRRSCDA